MQAASQANLWLNILNGQKHKLVPIYRGEMERLSKLAPILSEKVVKDAEGRPHIFYIDRLKAIEILKQVYRFKTQEEATKEIQEVHRATHI